MNVTKANEHSNVTTLQHLFVPYFALNQKSIRVVKVNIHLSFSV